MRVDADDFARPCSCGREHHIDVREIVIESGAIGKLEKEMSDGDLKECISPLLICDTNSYKATEELMEDIYDRCQVLILDAEGLEADELDLAILENVGNLVCPAEFDTGAVKNVMILSVPEGHDKPLKYPLMFSVCDVVLINKIDVLPYFDFDMEACKRNILMRNPKAKIIPISAKTGEGMQQWTEWLLGEVRHWKE